MAIESINAALLKQIFLSGAANLENNKEWINDLNVFPVPDGDTGTNMTMTILSAVREVEQLEDVTISGLARAISSGSLRGARGNSGVILSQLLRGFTREIRDCETITPEIAVSAFERATDTAYKAVIKPKEGTILTVAHGMSVKASEIVGSTADMEKMLEEIVRAGDEVLAKTPEMLPVLKQAGVVDSGGQGLMQVMKGALECLRGNPVERRAASEGTPVSASSGHAAARTEDLGEIRFGYCTEFIINLDPAKCHYDEAEGEKFREFLESMGDSIVMVSDDDIVKVHVHTNDPGVVITKALTYGSLSRMKIDNMREEHQEKLIRDASRVAAEQKAAREKQAAQTKEPEPRKPVGFVSVAAGKGMEEILRGLGVDEMVRGGQTMNPSTDDVVQAVNRVNADVVYVFPNNKNIVLAAEQARDLVKDRQVVVVPSSTIPQGIAAMIAYSPTSSAEDNLAVMKDSMELVKTGQVTYAVRDTTIDGKEIHKDDIMGLGDHSALLAVGSDRKTVVLDMVRAMADEDAELISVYYGDKITEKEAQDVTDALTREYPNCEVELNYGGQPVYYYIISVE